MRAIVMAGGEGSRLRPLTLTRPKPMLPIVNLPLLGHIFHLLREHGILNVLVTLQHLAAHIQDYYGDGKSLGMNIEYVIEESPLGTAGSVRQAGLQAPSDEPFLVISGDALTDFDLGALVAFHHQRGALVTMALYHVPNPLEYGVINVGADGRIAQFQEKPSWGELTSDTVNTGIYVMQPAVLDAIQPGSPSDWSQDVFPAMLARGEPLYGFIAQGYWCDIGTLSEYRRANSDVLNGRLGVSKLGEQISGGVWTGGQVEISPDAQIIGPVYLGQEVQIKRDVIIQGPAVIRDYTVVDDGARIVRSIIWRNCYVGQRAELHGAVVGRQCSLKARSVVFEGAVIGDRTVIGEGAMIQSNVKIWPGKEVESGTTVNHSIIWGSQGRRILFGRYGVTGVVNVDLTPDFVARLGAALGSVLPKGSTVTINRDPHRSARMIKRALISGLPSAGNNVVDLRTVPIPVARYYTRAIRAAAGVHVRLSPYDPRVVDIRFFHDDGLDLTREQERAVERIFFREDYRRAFLDDIGSIDYTPDAAELYSKGYLAAINAEIIRSSGLKIVADYAHSPAADLLPILLSELNVEVVPLNARVDAGRIALSQESFRAGRSQLAAITSILHDVSLGVRLDVGGEKIYVVANSGDQVPENVMCAAMASLVLQSHPGCTIAITVDQSLIFEKLAARFGGVVRRCAVDPQSLMAAADHDGVMMASDGAGNFVFPAFHPAIDGLFAVGKLLELLALRRVSLSSVIEALPEFHVDSGKVEVLWEQKGRVMRRLLEHFAGFPCEKLDGIKIHLSDADWVLIRPDEDSAIFHVVAEGSSAERAREILKEHGELVAEFAETSSFSSSDLAAIGKGAR